MADDRLPTLLASLPRSSPYFSLEFFPPKTSSGFSNLQSRLARMATALHPLFVTVTWGAGGSTATKSLELAEVCQRQLGLTTVLHLTCTNMKRSAVDDALESAKEVGIRNILALRGDPPREEYRDTDEGGSGGAGTDSNDEFVWAVDLVRYIRRKHGDYFSIGVAGYPEGHADESNPQAGKQSVDHDLPYLVEKVAAGADFIMTQLSYDINAYERYEKRLRDYVDDHGNKLFAQIPIIPGLMPIQSYQIIKRITKLSHAKIPEEILRRIEAVKSDDEAVKTVGVDILSELVDQIKLLPQPEGTARGFHFYTLNLEKSVAFILERTGLIPSMSEPETSAADSSDSEAVVDDDKSAHPSQPSVAVRNGTRTSPPNINTNGEPRFSRRRASSANAQPHNRVITSADRSSTGEPPRAILTTHTAAGRGTGIPAASPSRHHNLLISEGQGSLGREATWDDFPNGRWGPSHSPAFGEIDGYGPSLKVGPITARKLWGHPKCEADVTELFRRHVMGGLEAVPWSDEVDPDAVGTENGAGGSGALRAETDVIRQELISLITKKGYWTLASQPAVDGAKSEDPTFGWGPPGEGFVFQKAFVEFFCPRDEWERDGGLRDKLSRHGSDVLSWMKTDFQGVFESSELLAAQPQQQAPKTTQKTPEQDDSEKETGTENKTEHRSLVARIPGAGAPDEASTVNAVTWGVFRGKEIITPTIIEPESFRAWGDEAYSVWSEWRRCFPRGSAEEIFLEDMRRRRVLVNIVGQGFRGGHGREHGQEGNAKEPGDGGQVWRILLSED